MRFASDTTRVLHGLGQTMADHLGITLEAMSARALGKGGFFAALGRGRDCRTATAERVLAWLDGFWPEDLCWRGDLIARPSGSRLPVPTARELADLTHEPIWLNGRRPAWWGDLEIRQFLTTAHRQMSILEAARVGAQRFGDRCPKKSAIHAYWQRLDRLHLKQEEAA